jgi:AcrR family transcriptional regulator
MSAADHRPRVAAQRRERMRARLLDSALLLAAAQGPEALTIDNVTAAAAVSRGTFYKYFDAPSSLMQALAAEVSQAVIETLQPQVEPLDDLAERVAVGVRTALRLVRAHPMLGAFMVRAGWPVMDRTHLFFTAVGADIAEGIRRGRFARMHADVGLNVLAGSLVGAMHSTTHGKVPRDFAEQTAAAVLRALGLPPDEALALSTGPLVLPAIAPGSLLTRLLGPRAE